MDICPNRDSPPEHFSAANINPSPTNYISPKKTMANYAKRNSSSDDNETALNALKSYSYCNLQPHNAFSPTVLISPDTPTAPDGLRQIPIRCYEISILCPKQPGNHTAYRERRHSLI